MANPSARNTGGKSSSCRGRSHQVGSPRCLKHWRRLDGSRRPGPSSYLEHSVLNQAGAKLVGFLVTHAVEKPGCIRSEPPRTRLSRMISSKNCRDHCAICRGTPSSGEFQLLFEVFEVGSLATELVESTVPILAGAANRPRIFPLPITPIASNAPVSCHGVAGSGVW